MKKPNPELLKEYQDAAEGDIRYITVSPEIEGIPDMIPYIKSLGIQVAIGHSGADYDTAMKAIRNGAMGATHTGNAMKLLHQHFPAIWGAVLEDDEVYCEMIVASATPATLILNPMTNTRFSPALITPAMVRKYSGRLVSPTARSTAAQKL